MHIRISHLTRNTTAVLFTSCTFGFARGVRRDVRRATHAARGRSYSTIRTYAPRRRAVVLRALPRAPAVPRDEEVTEEQTRSVPTRSVLLVPYWVLYYNCQNFVQPCLPVSTPRLVAALAAHSLRSLTCLPMPPISPADGPVAVTGCVSVHCIVHQ